MLVQSPLCETLIQSISNMITQEFLIKGYSCTVSGYKKNTSLVFDILVPSISFSHTLIVPIDIPFNKLLQLCCPVKKINYTAHLDLVSLRRLIRSLN